ncbi:caspase family protein [Mesorhizobium sp. M3A.F.Ca.ET.080.04.2.1]|uniref:caspase family protein n=1 Tax=Mesorhizobium sp. M3A.F.Ca.ET.080.04.2.1 TaxID=2493676 RepID=UPI0013EB46A3|nr:caspase family protein [Mesorhizobium sp. M3A.F.Ca.ET.080.04.2.1]
MANIAILIGNAQYEKQKHLPCCKHDVAAIKSAIVATQKFDRVLELLDVSAAEMKEALRDALSTPVSNGEVFFYFTGHGYHHTTDFFYCARDFDIDRPNETGLSNTDLHSLLRATDPGLVVKLIDACNSGTLLIKSDAFWRDDKAAFKKLIQIASCLDNQNSLTGDPLSLFTQQFMNVLLKKNDGPIYYMDIIGSLRDLFINNNDQTPHFISQWTGRETFVDDASKLALVRTTLAPPALNPTKDDTSSEISSGDESLLAKLKAIESDYADRQKMEAYIAKLFSTLRGLFTNGSSFGDCYTVEFSEFKNYTDDRDDEFIVRCLNKENRPDNFVSAEIIRTPIKKDYFSAIMASAFVGRIPGTEYDEKFSLNLNCSLDSVQMQIVMTPLFRSIKKITLLVTCAPSLNNCYIFEGPRIHSLNDWNAYDSVGVELKRRWFERSWNSEPTEVAHLIFNQLKELVVGHIKAVVRSSTE